MEWMPVGELPHHVDNICAHIPGLLQANKPGSPHRKVFGTLTQDKALIAD